MLEKKSGVRDRPIVVGVWGGEEENNRAVMNTYHLTQNTENCAT